MLASFQIRFSSIRAEFGLSVLQIKTHHPWHWYLERVAKTMLRGAHGSTGYMDGTVYRECLQALIHEGETNATIMAWATTLNTTLHKRQLAWTHEAYPCESHSRNCFPAADDHTMSLCFDNARVSDERLDMLWQDTSLTLLHS